LSQAELQEIVDVQITRDIAGLTRVGFGTALLAAPGVEDITGEVVEAFASLAGVVDAGFEAGTDVYRAAAAYFGQALRPERLLIGEYDSSAPVTSLTAIDAVNPDWYALIVIDTDGVVGGDTRIDRMVDIAAWIQAQERIVGFLAFGADTIDETVGDDTTTLSARLRTLSYDRAFTVWTGDSSLVENDNLVTNGDFADGATGWTVSQGSGNFAGGNAVMTSTATNPWASNLNQAIDFPEAGIYTLTIDVTAISVATARLQVFLDATEIYDQDAQEVETITLELDIPSAGEYSVTLTAGNGVGEAQFTITYDNIEILVPGETVVNVASPAAYLGRMLPTDPGSNSWAHKQLAGVTPAALSANQRTNLFAKNVNLFSNVTGIRAMRYGTVATGEYIDIIHGIDWLVQRIREDYFRLFVNSPKVPYTDQGIAAIENALRSRLRVAQDVGLIAPDTATEPGFTVTVPRITQTELADRADRILRDVEFNARLAGAIHKTVIRGHVAP